MTAVVTLLVLLVSSHYMLHQVTALMIVRYFAFAFSVNGVSMIGNFGATPPTGLIRAASYTRAFIFTVSINWVYLYIYLSLCLTSSLSISFSHHCPCNHLISSILSFRLMQVGEEFCGSKSEVLQESIKRQSINYFKNYHR